jgi:hypothetical protein
MTWVTIQNDLGQNLEYSGAKGGMLGATSRMIEAKQRISGEK